MNSADRAHRLHVTLPAVWRIVPRDEWPTDLIARVDGHHTELGVSARVPDLLATTFAAVATHDKGARAVANGDLSGADYLLAAGLTITTLELPDVPEALRSDRAPHVSQRDLVVGDTLVSFLVGTHVRIHAGSDLASLLTVSSPNLAQAQEIIDGFAAIADTVRVSDIAVGPAGSEGLS